MDVTYSDWLMKNVNYSGIAYHFVMYDLFYAVGMRFCFFPNNTVIFPNYLLLILLYTTTVLSAQLLSYCVLCV